MWPRAGRCGACGRPAIQFPSERWEHDGAPCVARSQGIWRVGDFSIADAVRFVVDGEPLPVAPEGWHSHVTETQVDGFPTAIGMCQADHMVSVRAYLAAEAEGREVACG